MRVLLVLAALCLAVSAKSANKYQYTFKAPMVIRGVDAPAGRWNWQVSLRYLGSHTCGGTLIKANKVLTAAHCVNGRYDPDDPDSIDDFSIQAGTVDRTVGGSIIHATAIVEHADYEGIAPFPNDVAVVTLASNANTSDANIALATLAPLNTGGTDYDNNTCYKTGWGANAAGNLPNHLQEAITRVVPLEECGNEMPVEGAMHICVMDDISGNRAGVCSGDSGGPLNCPTADSTDFSSYIVTGVTSFVRVSFEEGCEVGVPQVYGRVSFHREFIDANS